MAQNLSPEQLQGLSDEALHARFGTLPWADSTHPA